MAGCCFRFPYVSVSGGLVAGPVISRRHKGVEMELLEIIEELFLELERAGRLLHKGGFYLHKSLVSSSDYELDDVPPTSAAYDVAEDIENKKLSSDMNFAPRYYTIFPGKVTVDMSCSVMAFICSDHHEAHAEGPNFGMPFEKKVEEVDRSKNHEGLSWEGISSEKYLANGNLVGECHKHEVKCSPIEESRTQKHYYGDGNDLKDWKRSLTPDNAGKRRKTAKVALPRDGYEDEGPYGKDSKSPDRSRGGRQWDNDRKRERESRWESDRGSSRGRSRDKERDKETDRYRRANKYDDLGSSYGDRDKCSVSKRIKDDGTGHIEKKNDPVIKSSDYKLHEIETDISKRDEDEQDSQEEISFQLAEHEEDEELDRIKEETKEVIEHSSELEDGGSHMPEAVYYRADGGESHSGHKVISVGKSSNQDGFATNDQNSGAGGLGQGTPKSERSNDMFCDDIFGESPAAVHKTGKGDGLIIERSGLHDNWDDAEGYYSYRFGEVLDDRYEIIASHGKGVFSTVVRARDLKAKPGDPEEVAIKMIRNNGTMYKAGMEELVILKKLVGVDPEDRRHCVRFLSSFKTYAKQLFISLKHLKNCGVLHSDIKPDNMLVNEGKNVLKLCDFGNAMFAGKNEITPYLFTFFLLQFWACPMTIQLICGQLVVVYADDKLVFDMALFLYRVLLHASAIIVSTPNDISTQYFLMINCLVVHIAVVYSYEQQ
nr:serine/threonine-protein kinase prpf4B [Ipomoea batatas]